MRNTRDWPPLEAEGPWSAETAFERTCELAARALAFESALEQALEEGLDLAPVEKDLADWDAAAAEVFRYTGLGDGDPLPADLEGYRDALRDRSETLRRARAGVLARLPKSDANVLAEREGAAQIDQARLRERAAPAESLAEFEGDAPPAQDAQVSAPSKPVAPEEVKMRAAAEQKPMPESGKLAGLLALLPSEWIAAVFETLKLKLDDDEEFTAGSRAAARRGVIHKSLLDPAFLSGVVARLDDPERNLLGVLTERSPTSYQKVREKFGSDEADGFYWSERSPSGPLAKLRRAGLAYVAVQNGVAALAVPRDLKDELTRLLVEVTCEAPLPLEEPVPAGDGEDEPG